ncbi:MAG: hypothetical protein JXR78_15325 [Victivallales bacterium]|nr:hypothetical protein [Victivallales bacterium]
MKTIIKLTPLESDFLSRVENNPQAKKHERYAAITVLRMAKIKLSIGEGLSSNDQAILEILNKGHASMARSILFFLKKAYPAFWAGATVETEVEK